MARRQVSIFINGREVATQVKAITSEKRKIVNELNRMVIGSDEYNKKVKELDKVNSILNKHRDNIRGTTSTWNKLKGAAVRFGVVAAAAFVAKELVQYGAKLFELGVEMELLGRKAKTVFGEALPLVTKAAEENANAMGLTAGQYTDAATAIGDLLIPMGFARDEAANISTNMVDLSGALSEWTGGQKTAAEVTDILGKAMLGEREQLKGLGIAINEADVKNRLAEKGLSDLTGEMLQQAKAAATLELITEKSADAQTAYGENSDTLARKKAFLTARIAEVSEKLATTLLPIFNRLLEIALGAAEGVLYVANAISRLAGNTEDTNKQLDKTAENTKSYGQAMKEAGESTDLLAEAEKRFAENDDLGKKKDRAKELAKERKKAAEAIAKQQEKEAADLLKREQDLADAVAKIQADRHLQELSEEEQQLAALAGKYDEQIQIARELEAKGSEEAIAQRLALQTQKEAALVELQNQLFEEELARIAEQEDARTVAELEAIRKKEEAKRDAIAQIREEVKGVFLSEREQQLLDLEEQFNGTLELAEAHEIDTLDIKLAYQKKKADLVKKFDQEDKAQLLKSQKEQAEALAQGFGAASNVIGSAIDALGDKAKESTLLGKGLALTQIGISSAEAIAKGTAASAGVPFPGNLVAIASTVATVLSQIAAARKILNQKKDGGWHNVVGAQDKQTYRAKYIGSRPSGMLPHHPVVLASEAGPEYFVSNRDLNNPYVLDHVQAIENIIHHRHQMPQFMEGGFNGEKPTTPSPALPTGPSETDLLLIAVLESLSTKIDKLVIRMDDQTIIDTQKRFQELNNASGGILN